MNKWRLPILGAVALIALFFVLHNRSSEKKRRTIDQANGSSPSQEMSSKSSRALDATVESPLPGITRQTALLKTGSGTASSVEEFLQKLSPNAKWTFHRDDQQRVYSMMGGLVPDIADQPDKLKAFAWELASYLGVDPDQIVMDTSFAEKQKNPLDQTHNFKQEYEGFEVYDSYLRIFSRSKDNSIYFINNELKEIGRPSVDIRIESEALPAIVSGILGAKTYWIESTSPKPLLFVQKPGQSELVWQVVVKIDAPLKDRREILISARTGEALQNLSTVSRN